MPLSLVGGIWAALTAGLFGCTLFRIRLINLVAEDNAIEDTIYHLHRALNAGRIDLERFLRVGSKSWLPPHPGADHMLLIDFVSTITKTTRVLAEEQFMKRALIEKIQEGVPIEPTLSYK